ncbi:DksA/TraR family C4-type zinc finger protein [Shewanella waksmanii]|uniref:DksA/TraR family C4-type zinc finger protein n=1 Tax=Shewanella waksmanii TaxID=213783 RepID=UPI003735B331
MAGGWSKDGAVQEQIDSSIDDAVAAARNLLNRGDSLAFCQECGEPIPKARQVAVVGVRYCIECQNMLDRDKAKQQLFNRRGSKDSQLR